VVIGNQMKKIFFITIVMLTFFGLKEVSAQKVAIGGEFGVNLFAKNSTNLAFPIGLTSEVDINGKLSAQFHLAFDIGLGAGDFNLFYVSPEARYHFSEVFKGAYLGGYLGFGPAFGNGAALNAFYFSVGASGGYELMFMDILNIDLSAQLGFGRVGSNFGSTNGVHFRPTVAVRYLF
jgi:hypothetical protein